MGGEAKGDTSKDAVCNAGLGREIGILNAD